jgi:hypothetical protein
MRDRTIRTAAAFAVLFGSTSLVLAAAAPAFADTSKILPVASTGDVVVDGVHQRIYISDPRNAKIVATNYDGTVVGTRGNLPGVLGLALSADSEQLYGAVNGADAIVSIATKTFTETAQYATGKDTDPAFLAVAGGKVWFSYAGDSSSRGGTGNGSAKGNIGSLDLTGAEPAVQLDQDKETKWEGAPKLAATTGAPNVLAAGDPVTSARLVGVFDVSTDTPTRTALKGVTNGHTNDLALTPDGSRLVTARVGGVHEIWKTSNLSAAGTYPTEHYANAVAVASDGTVAAGSDATYNPDVHVFKPGSMTPVRKFDFPNTGNSSGSDTLAEGGLAWEPGGSRLFAVTSNSNGEYSLRELTDPTKPTTPGTDTSPILPVMSVGDIVVDGVHKRVFISDPMTSKIVATDYSGKVVDTRENLPGVQGLALSADSSHLYGAVPGDDSIVSIATDSVTETARYPTGEGTAPEHLAVAGGKIWFGYGVDWEGGNVGSVDVTGEKPTVALGQDDASDWYGAPRLAAASGTPNVLVAADATTSSGRTAVYDLSTGTAARTAFGTNPEGTPRDLALTPDGSRLVTANSGGRHLIWKTSDLSAAGAYSTQHHPNAVAIAPDGTVAAGSSTGYYDDVFVFRPGSTTAVRTFDFPDTGGNTGADDMVDRALAWDPNGTRLFAVSVNSEDVLSLQTLVDPAKSAPILTVTAPATAKRAKPLTVSGTLTATLPLPVGTPLTVTRTDLESPKGKSLGTKKLAAKNQFSFADTPPAGGKVTYKVSYAGDATHIPASGSDSVTVAKDSTTLTLDRNGKTYSYGKKVSFNAHLGKTYKNRVVEIWADPYGADKPKKLVKKGKVNSKGNLPTTLTLTRNVTVTAIFTGDSRSGSRTVKSTAYANVKVSTAISRHYKTGKIGSTKYHYVHKRTDPLFTTTMTAYKDRYQRLTLEVYYQGKWYSGGSQYFELDAKGKSKIWLEGPHETGLRMRMRSSYVKGSAGDSLNATTHGAWKYFIFTK